LITITGANLLDVSAVHLEYAQNLGGDWTVTTDTSTGDAFKLPAAYLKVDSDTELTFISPCVSRDDLWRDCAAATSGVAPTCGFRVVLTTTSTGLPTKTLLDVPLLSYQTAYSYSKDGQVWTYSNAVAKKNVRNPSTTAPLFVCYRMPAITSILPKLVQPGSNVVVTGSNFGARRPDCGSPAPYFSIAVGNVACVPPPGECFNEILAWSSVRIEFRISSNVPSGEHVVAVAVGGNLFNPLLYRVQGPTTINVQNEGILPQNVRYVSNTNVSTTIQWSSPVVTNSLVQYHVMWTHVQGDTRFVNGARKVLPVSATSCVLEPLVIDTMYRVRVVAEHTSENGTAPDIFIQHSIEPVAPVWHDTPVTFVSISGNDVRAVATFKAPSKWNGGSEDSYVLEWTNTNTSQKFTKTVAVDTKSASNIQSELLTGLLPHVDYQLTVKATSKALRGSIDDVGAAWTKLTPQSALWDSASTVSMSSPYSTTATWKVTVPQQPSGLSLSYLKSPFIITNRVHDVALTWSAPQVDGNAPISDYKIAYVGDRTFWSDGSNVSFALQSFNFDQMAQTVVTQKTIASIQFGYPICFTISAKNAIGLGEATSTGTMSSCTCGASYYLDETDPTNPMCRSCGTDCDFCASADQCYQCAEAKTLSLTGQCVAKDACGEEYLPKDKLGSDPTQGSQCVPAGNANSDCTAGQRIIDVDQCGLCPEGTYSDRAGTTAKMKCMDCPLGAFTSNAGQSTCALCPEGKFTDTVGSSSCSFCSQGKYNPRTGLTASACDDCPTGRFISSVGATQCNTCAVGFFAAAKGQAACIGCEIGSFAQSQGQSTCSKCDDGKYSINKASVCWTCAGDNEMPGFTCNRGELTIEEGFWFDDTKIHTIEHIDGTSTEFVCPGVDEDGQSCPYDCTLQESGEYGNCKSVDQTVLYECPEERSGGTVCAALISSADDFADYGVVPATNTSNASTVRLIGSLESPNSTIKIPRMNCTHNSRGVLCQLCDSGFKRGGAPLGCEPCEKSAVILGFNMGQWLLNSALFTFGFIVFLISLCCMRSIRTKAKLYDTVHTIIVLKWFLRKRVIPRAKALVEQKRRKELGLAPEPMKTEKKVADKQHIKIVIVSARHLTSTDADGKCDPFVKVFWRPGSSHSWMDMRKSTKAINDTLNPVWNKSFTMRTHKGLEPQVKLELWDDDGVGMFADDPIGYVVYTLEADGPSTGWKNIKGATGQLQANVGYFPFTPPPQLPCFETKQTTCYVRSMKCVPDRFPTSYVKLLTRPDVSCEWTDTAFRTVEAGAVGNVMDLQNSKFTFDSVIGAHPMVRLMLCEATSSDILGHVDIEIKVDQRTHGFHRVKLHGSRANSGESPPLLRAAVGFGVFPPSSLAEDNAAHEAFLSKEAHDASSTPPLAASAATTRHESALDRFRRAARSTQNAALMVGTTGAILGNNSTAINAMARSDQDLIGRGMMGVAESNFEGNMAEHGGEADLEDIEGDGVLGIGTTDTSDAMRGDVNVINEMAGDATSAVNDIDIPPVDASGFFTSIVDGIRPVFDTVAEQGKQVYEAVKDVYEPVMSQWKVLLGNFQILSSLQIVFSNVPWPENYLNMLESFEIFKFDLFGSVKVVVPCVDITFYDGVRAFLFLPLIAVVAMLLAVLWMGGMNVILALCCKPCLSMRGCRKRREVCAQRGCCVDPNALLRIKRRTASTEDGHLHLTRKEKAQWREANCKMRCGARMCPCCCKKDLDWSTLPPLSCQRGEVHLCPIKMEYIFVAEKLAITLLLLVYPGLCNKCFLLFQCVEISGVKYLSSDYEQICWEGDHLRYFIAACFGVAVYIAGVPLFILFRLIMFRCFSGARDAHGRRISLLHRPATSTFLLDPYSDTINPREIETARRTLDKQHYIWLRYGGLYDPYEDEYWYFELIAIMRKLFLTGVIVLLANADSPLLQLLAAIVVCLAYLVLVTSCQPFIDPRDDRLAAAEALQMLMTMIIALALAMNKDSEDDDTTPYLGYVLIGLTVFVLVIAVYQLPLLPIASHFCCCCCKQDASSRGKRKRCAECFCRRSEKVHVQDDSMRSIDDNKYPALVDSVVVDGGSVVSSVVVTENTVAAYEPIETTSANVLADVTSELDTAAEMDDMLAEAEAFLSEFDPPAEKIRGGRDEDLDAVTTSVATKSGKELNTKYRRITTQESARSIQLDFMKEQEDMKKELATQRVAKEKSVRQRMAKRRVKQLKALRKRFAEIDADGDGSISTTELMALLPTDISVADAAALVEKYDADGSGDIDLEEFEGLMKAVKQLQRKAQKSASLFSAPADNS
jgi:hypothetical protein